MLKSVVFFIVLLLMKCVIGCQEVRTNDNAYSNPKEVSASIARGKYLVQVMDCHSCHTPKIMTPEGYVPDMDRAFMGFPADGELPPNAEGGIHFNNDLTAYSGPWGISFAANISNDFTGIGDWNFEQFRVAMQEGKFRGNKQERGLLPPMPWESYRELHDDDLKSIFMFLKTSRRIHNVVPDFIDYN
ncbi:diheme cytochrome c-553 [Flavobacterium orientale]|uniref:Cytochrome c domain-containing protein n=1 Tax=Flavobacterium orientale TaxID=1756020 RepID=A0A916XV72_9FLAO|nr:diheme cytochrome c-553 [Flavobacterium orientale]GGD14131.1 hypothetical protein GCM10011343_01480 [Flavobacterium orientale]